MSIFIKFQNTIQKTKIKKKYTIKIEGTIKKHAPTPKNPLKRNKYILIFY